MLKRNLVFIASAILLNACLEHHISIEEQQENETDKCNNGDDCSDNKICYSDNDGTHTCMLDSDGDQVPDKIDCCPYNQDVKDIKNDATCSDSICPSKPDTQGVFHIYHAQNLVDLYNYTINNNPTYNEFNTVVLENDIDLTELKDKNDYDDCQINLKLSDGSPFILTNIVIRSKDDSKPNTIRSSKCSITQALFDELINCNVHNINLQYNVDDKIVSEADAKARAMLANKIIFNSELTNNVPDSWKDNPIDYYNHYIDISYSGEIISKSQYSVGGLVAEVVLSLGSENENNKPYLFQFENCLANGISIHAPNASTVGGLIGNGEYVDLSMDNSDETNAFIINDIEGQNFVGGVVGKYCYNEKEGVYNIKCGTVPKQEDNKYFRVIFKSINGHHPVGGFMSLGVSNNNISIVGNTLKGHSYTGGIRGGTIDQTSGNQVDDSNSHLAVSIDNIIGSSDTQTDGAIGGIVGSTGCTNASYSNILTEIQKIKGNQFIGGIIGQRVVYQTTDPVARIILQSITNNVAIIEGGSYVNGVVFFNNLSNGKYSQYEANIDSISSFVKELTITDQTVYSVFSNNTYIINGLFGIRPKTDVMCNITLNNASVVSTRKLLNAPSDSDYFIKDSDYLVTQAIGSTTSKIKLNDGISEDRNNSICYFSTFYNENKNISEYPLNQLNQFDNITRLKNTTDARSFISNHLKDSDSYSWEPRYFDQEITNFKMPYLYQENLETELHNLQKIYCNTFGNISQFCKN